MSIGGVLLGLIHLAIYCALVVFVAVCIVWGFKEAFGKDIDPTVYKWGRILVILLCAAAVIVFLLSLIPGTGVHMPYLFRL